MITLTSDNILKELIQKRIEIDKQINEYQNQNSIWSKQIVPDNILIDYVAFIEYFGYTKENILGKTKTEELSIVRGCIIHHLCKRGYSLTSIAKTFNKNHSTVIYWRDMDISKYFAPKIYGIYNKLIEVVE